MLEFAAFVFLLLTCWIWIPFLIATAIVLIPLALVLACLLFALALAPNHPMWALVMVMLPIAGIIIWAEKDNK